MVRAVTACERTARRRERAQPLGSRRSSKISNLAAVMTFGLLVGAPLGAFLAPATSRAAFCAAHPTPTLLHRDRVFGVEVPADLDDKHTADVSERLRHALAERLGLGAPPPLDDIQLVRKSLDARPRRAGGRRGKLIGGHEVAWSPSST